MPRYLPSDRVESTHQGGPALDGFVYRAAVQRYGMIMPFTTYFTWLYSALVDEGGGLCM